MQSSNKWQPDKEKVISYAQELIKGLIVSTETVIDEKTGEEVIDKETGEKVKKTVPRPLPPGYANYVLQFAQIATFLNNNVAVMNQLKKINSLLIDEALRRKYPIEEPESITDFRQKKILREVLERELHRFGFEAQFAKATNILSSTLFRSALSQGYVVKDPGAPIEHGEFTHALQWLAICLQQDESSFLKMPVIEIYKALGHDNSLFFIDDKDDIWTEIVDLVPSDIEDIDFRSPESLQERLKNTKDKELAFLSLLIRIRTEKRKQPFVPKLVNNGDDPRADYPPKRAYDPSPQGHALLLPKRHGLK